VISHRLVLATVVLAGFGTACTAIVLGKVSDSDGYTTLAPGKTPPSPGELDECSLLRSNSNQGDRDANACSDCIQTSCPTDVAFACNRDKTPKSWFSKMKDCAQDPWQNFRPPTEPSGFYSCKTYETPAEVISDNGSDAERESAAHNCITAKCLSGELPACKRCEVSINKPGSTSEKALLRDDACGKCMVESCEAVLVRCCNLEPMQEFVQKCAFTNSPSNKAACLELGNADPDAGRDKTDTYNAEDTQCLKDLAACFKTSCASAPGCQ
jgi:hypothetical protein